MHYPIMKWWFKFNIDLQNNKSTKNCHGNTSTLFHCTCFSFWVLQFFEQFCPFFVFLFVMVVKWVIIYLLSFKVHITSYNLSWVLAIFLASSCCMHTGREGLLGIVGGPMGIRETGTAEEFNGDFDSLGLMALTYKEVFDNG